MFAAQMEFYLILILVLDYISTITIRNATKMFNRCVTSVLWFSVLWKTLITRYGGLATEALDVSSLAKITDGYTPGHMAQAIQQILTERRIQQVLFVRNTTKQV